MYQAYVDQSDVFVGIYWQRYGWVAPGMEISGLEDEYRLAEGKPMLLYIKRPAPNQESRLLQFLDTVRNSGTVSYRRFSTTTELDRLLLDDLALLLSESFQGAVRSEEAEYIQRSTSESRRGLRSTNFPPQLTSFVGRASDVRDAIASLAAVRLLTLTGVGGVGKTRLAVEVGARVSSEYPDGCWLCPLAPAGDPDAVIEIVAGVVGAEPRQGLSLESSLIEFAEPKRLLIVLDNCEHVLETSANLAYRLLQGCPGVKLLVTSRQRLDVEGENVIVVQPFSVPRESAAIEDVRSSDAVQLFVDRARAVRSNFEVSQANSSAVSQIVRNLDGIPLALELAAARLDAMSPSEVATLLQERFRLLTRGRRSADSRHQTLRATVDWSYALLSPDEQAVFGRLGVFRGTFNLEAATAVATTEDARWELVEALSSLVAKSMVLSSEGPDGVERYRLLETLQQYALEKLQEGGSDEECRRRHAEHFAGPKLIGPDELSWRPRLLAEFENLREAVNWALHSPRHEDGELAVRIAASLSSYSQATTDISPILEQVTRRCSESPPPWRGAILGAAAFNAFQNRGDFALAEALAREALSEPVDPRNLAPAHAFATMIAVLTWSGRVSEGQLMVAEALETLTQIAASDYHRVLLLITNSVATSVAGLVEEAKRCALQSLAFARHIGNPSALAAALWVAAQASAGTSADEAMDFVEEAIALSRTGASRSVLGHVLAIRAQLRAGSGDGEGAVEDLREAIAYSRDKGDRVMLSVGFDRGIVVMGALAQWKIVALLAGVTSESGPLSKVSRLPRMEREERASIMNTARAELGADVFRACESRGAQMTVREVVENMLGELNKLEDADGSPRSG
jgi:predicted ATPase